jgi:hypothetical protein
LERILKYKFEIIAGSLGAAAGFSYWYFVGCASGNCAITSNPWMSSIYGALVGGMLPGILMDKKTRIKQQTK